ncbi:MAG: sulfate respiration complex protein HmcE [Desulfovibrio sp.]|jgi:nitrate reductase gamma subunit
MYQIITGPLLWLTFLVFVGGLAWRVYTYIKGLDWKLDRVAYGTQTAYGVRGAARSIAAWIVPFGSQGWKVKPIFTILFFVFHIGIVITPLFLLGHAEIVKMRFGLGWPALPMAVADVLTVAMMCAGAFIIVRRIALPEVRIITSLYDYLLLVITIAPFFTGFMAVHQLGGDYTFWLYAHILSGELMLLAIPFTKLFHVVGFFLSRGQLGMDYGIKRGGMKGTNMAW